MNMIPPKAPPLFLSLVYFALGIYLAFTGSNWLWLKKMDEFVSTSEDKQAFYTTYLQGLLQKTENIPPLLANNEKLINILLHPHGKEVESINIFLESITNISGSSDIYLMDHKGVTVAASNWQKPHSFVGKDFSFRPYFTTAINGRQGRYYAMGTTSSKRGYYFSYPITFGEEIIGVVAVKTDIELVEKNWNHLNDSILITDPDGIIFLTTKHIWLYNSVTPLAEGDQQRIAQSRRYPINNFVPISRNIENIGGQNFLHIADGDEEILLLQHKVPMPDAGWDLHVLTDMEPANHLRTLFRITALTCLLFFYILVTLLIQRYQKQLQLIAIKEANRKELEELNTQLEVRVQDRTKELFHSNTLLQNTKDELNHAAKMAALGQMSAQINHELNQPLAAIRSYADNAQLFLGHQRVEDARSNLQQISELTERMAKTGQQLKLFSRKSSGELSTVSLMATLNGAMSILGPSLKRNNVTLITDIRPENSKVLANGVLLQQVLVNLFANAVDAMKDSKEKEIHFTAHASESQVTITVSDTGPGIQESDAAHIFEPFYTTKKSGRGLGLGLTISYRIIEEIGGSLQLIAHKGACFSFSLTRAIDE